MSTDFVPQDGDMAWLRIDDRVRTHPKIALAGPAAAWLWFCGICYCREHLTDGFISKAVVPALAMNLPSPWRLATKLVEVNLWEDAPGGYQVHDFLDWNPSKKDVLEGRASEADRKRKERGVSGRTKPGVQEMSSCVRAGDAGLGSVLGSEDLDLREEETPISTVPARWRPAAPVRESLTSGEAYHRRNCAAWAYAACEAGICVPKYLWPQWEKRQSVDALRAFVEAWAPRAKGDKAEEFWPEAFKAHFGASAPGGKGDRTTRTLTALDIALSGDDAAMVRKAVGDGA